MRILSIHPRGTSRVLLRAVKSYDMGLSALLPIRQEGELRIFIALVIHRLGRVRTRNVWVQWQAH
jgi:hypothetical protein